MAVGENIIVTPKGADNFSYIAITILDSSVLLLWKLSLLIFFNLVYFLTALAKVITLSLSDGIAKIFPLLFAIAFKRVK